MGLKNFFMIIGEKIKSAFVKIKNAFTKFFEKALNMMKKVLSKLEEKLRKPILGATHFFRRLGNKYQEGTKNYTVDEELGEWNETTVTREITIDDVPPKYLTMDDEFEIDDTQELDNALSY